MDTEKSKGNPKARVDLAELCNRPLQEMRAPRAGKNWKRPKADFVLAPDKGGK
jgi:Ni/Co efflux regulator RcnB